MSRSVQVKKTFCASLIYFAVMNNSECISQPRSIYHHNRLNFLSVSSHMDTELGKHSINPHLLSTYVAEERPSIR